MTQYWTFMQKPSTKKHMTQAEFETNFCSEGHPRGPLAQRLGLKPCEKEHKKNSKQKKYSGYSQFRASGEYQ